MCFIRRVPPGSEADLAHELLQRRLELRAVSDLVSPVSGTVCAVNEELLDAPELLNSQCYDAWIIKVEGVTATDELLDAAQYEAFCQQEG